MAMAICAFFAVAAIVGLILHTLVRSGSSAQPVAAAAPLRHPWQNSSNSGSGLLLGLMCLIAIGGGFWFLNERQQEREREKERKRPEEEESRKKLAGLNEAYKQFAERQNHQTTTPSMSGRDDGLSLSAFNRIREGMSYDDVCRILGETGTLTVSTSFEGVPTTEAYEWSSGTKVVTCMFQGRKLITKAQAGLR